jgi:hypothetical protein
VHVTSTTFVPLLASAEDDPPGDPATPVLDELTTELAVAYSFGLPYGERLIGRLDLDRPGLSRRTLRCHGARCGVTPPATLTRCRRRDEYAGNRRP